MVSRSMEQVLPTDVPAHRVPPRSAEELLPRQKKKKAGAIDVSFKEPHLPIGVQRRSCDASRPSTYATCGMAVADGDTCWCWNYVAPFNLRTTLYLDKLMAWMKLPSRAFMYGQMKYWSVPIDLRTVDMYCSREQQGCEYEVHFSAKAKVLQWSWFGQQQKCLFTPEGMVIASVLLTVIVVPFLMSMSRLGTKKMDLQSFAALNRMICSHAIRS